MKNKIKNNRIAMVITIAIFILVITELTTGIVTYSLGTGLVKVSDILFKVGLQLEYAHRYFLLY